VSDYKVETVGDLHSRGFEYLRVVYVAEVEAKEDKIDRLQTLADELQARVSELVTALQDAVDIIQADANTEENYGALCRMGSALAKGSSAAWLLRQKADVIEQCMRDIHSLRSAFNLSEDETMGIKMAVQHCKGQVKDFSLAADKREVKDFRQAADEAEKAGGGV
jgi:hypothetical protein